MILNKEHSVIHKPGPIREFIERQPEVAPKPIPPPARSAPPVAAPVAAKAFPWWLFLLPLLCLPLCCCCCGKKKVKDPIIPPYKDPIVVDNPDTMPVR